MAKRTKWRRTDDNSVYLPHYDSDGIANIKNGKSVFERLHCIPHLLIADVLFLLFVVSIAVNLFLKDKIMLIHKINNIQNGTCNIRKKHYWNYFFHLVVKSYIVSLWLSMHPQICPPKRYILSSLSIVCQIVLVVNECSWNTDLLTAINQSAIKFKGLYWLIYIYVK